MFVYQLRSVFDAQGSFSHFGLWSVKWLLETFISFIENNL